MAFNILVAGNFSGRFDAEGTARHTNWPSAIRIDLDNFEDVMAALNPAVTIGGVTLEFRELEDFHPDRLHQHLRGLDEISKAAVPKTAPGSSQRPRTAGGSLLDSIVEEQVHRQAPVSVEDAQDLGAFLHRVTADHLSPREDVAARERVENAASEQMRGILHDPKFQAVEAAWRSLYFLLRAVDATAAVFLLDATLPELVRQADTLGTRLQARGPWSLLVVDYFFNQSETHAAVLGRLGTLAQSLGATLLSGATVPNDAGSAAWHELRHSAVAPHIGVVAPRFLLRLPYGKNSSAIDSFAFEEMPESRHEQYLWGNGAFAAGSLIGKAYDEEDRNWRKSLQRRIDNIPLHVYEEDGEHIAKPCAEVLMTERDAEDLLNAGVMPLASLKEQDGILLVQFRSIADPQASLAILTPR